MQNITWIEANDIPDDNDFGAAHRYNSDWNMPKFHLHPHYEFYLFLSGNVQILIEDETFLARPLDLFIFPPGTLHRAHLMDNHTPYERGYYYLTRKKLQDLSSPEYRMLDVLENAMRRKEYCYHIVRKDADEILRVIDTYISEDAQQDHASRMIQQLRANYLAVIACRIVEGRNAVRAQPQDRLSEIIRYINEHITEPLSLEAISEQFFISKYTLLHEFKSYANISVYQYILSKRVLYAQLLMQRGITPGNAAKQSGFNDYAGFYRAFMNQNNISPQNYYQEFHQPGTQKQSI